MTHPKAEGRRYGYACFYWLLRRSVAGRTRGQFPGNQCPRRHSAHAMTILIFAALSLKRFRFVSTGTILQQVGHGIRQGASDRAPRSDGPGESRDGNFGQVPAEEL